MTDTAKVSIVNTILTQLGNEIVPDLSDASLEASNAAVKVLRVLDDARDMVLSRHSWRCAMAYDTLARAVGTGAESWKFPNVFHLPGDGLAVWEIEDCPLTDYYSTFWRQRWELGTVDTDLGARVLIRSKDDNGSLNVGYTRRCSWAALSAHVRDAVAFEGAARACYSVTGDQPRTSALDKRAGEKFQFAVGQDGTQEAGQEALAPSIPQAIRNYSR